MGGLISLYGAMYFAKTFGGAGVFSPSLWLIPTAREDLKSIAEANSQFPQRFYFYGGAKEGDDMVTHINAIAELLREYAHYVVDVEIDPEGEHSEYHWRNKFPDYYSWLSQGMKL